MTVYAFLYNPMVHESAAYTVSLHLSKDGAIKAMEWHKEEKRKEWQLLVDFDEEKGTEWGYDKMCPFGSMENWIVEPVEILP